MIGCLVRRASSIPTLQNLSWDYKAGLDPFLSAQTTSRLVDMQKGLLQRLKHQIKETEFASQPLVDIVINTASKRDLALAFHYASLSMNNAFFLSCLRPAAASEKPTGTLLKRIEKTYGNFDTFKREFKAAANGMSASGYLWLVRDREENLDIIATYGAGSVLVRNRQSTRAAGQLKLNKGTIDNSSTGASSTAHQVYFSQSSADDKHIGTELEPLLCLSMYEHAYLDEYGIFGKEDGYVDKFWRCVNWDWIAATTQ